MSSSNKRKTTGSGIRDSGSATKDQGSGSRDQGSGIGDQGSGTGDQGSGSDGDSGQRLQKIIAQAGIASRRAAEQLIADGRVMINGPTVREMGTKADPARDDIRVDGRRVKSAERLRYILLYK